MALHERDPESVDVVVVGGGPAGLSAALVLGRARKKALLLDGGPRRNARAEHIHGFVTRDGTPPGEFRAIARKQLAPYDVAMSEARVVALTAEGSGFRVTLEGAREIRAERVVLATGVIDELPELPGLGEAWGRSVLQCPFCHGWEHRGERWGVIIQTPALADFARMLTGWSPEVTAFTNGTVDLPLATRGQLAGAGITIEQAPIRRLIVEGEGKLRGIELEDDTFKSLDVLFLKTNQHLPPLVESLGLARTELGYVRVNEKQETSVPGIYAAGDLTSPGQAALLAAAGGAMAGYMIVHEVNLHGRSRSA